MTNRPTPLSPEKISKLPKWARDHIRHVERNAAEAWDTVDELKGERPKPIAVRDPYGIAAPVAWDAYDEIRFAPVASFSDETNDWIGVRRREQGRIEISGSEGLAIFSRAANIVEIGLGHR